MPQATVYSNTRISIILQSTRWESRVIKKDIKRSKSGRSICVPLRTGGKGLLWIIGMYCPDSPTKNSEETKEEWEWLEAENTRGKHAGATVIVGGDFNTYGLNPHDRPSRTNRNPDSTRTGELFAQMMDRMELASTFRMKHPETVRYTFRRRKTGTQVTLDDIYVPTTRQRFLKP